MSRAPAWPPSLQLVRHGESEGNLADQRAYEAKASRLELDARDADVELSGTGRRQAEALGAWMAGREESRRPTVIISSPYRRAAATADAIADALGLGDQVQRDERLRERDLGMIDGLTSLGVDDLFPEEAVRRRKIGKFYYRPPGGESWCDVVLRVRSFLRSEVEGRTDDRLLVVSHQAVITNFRYVLEGLDETALLEVDRGPRLANCSVTTYRRDEAGQLRLETYNDVEALARLDQPVTQEETKETATDERT